MKQQEREHRNFQIKVVISWIALFALLLFLFSGFRLGDLKTIQLDGSFMSEWAPFIAEGVVVTLEICFISIFFASILALLAALGRLSHVAPLYALATFYVSLIRGTPLLLQIFFWFLALPQLGIVLPGMVAGVIALSLNYGAYMSEIFRAGIQGVSKGQREAALALGMTQGQTMRRIVLPQAFRFVVPPVGNEFIAMLKDSSLVSATGFVQDILWRAQKVGRANFHTLEALLIAAAWYWALTLIFSAIQSRLEKRLSRGDR
ncbi:MAG: amino acid ABC transporter permease [Chloroflexi bacterium]|nr:amino acid ABC transporter permease [Chloroflexota bacterium]